MKTTQQVLAAFEIAALNAGLLRDGFDIRTIQEQMGHTSVETTELYLHTTGGRSVVSPLDTTNNNITPFRKTA